MPKPGIANLAKWAEKTSLAVRRICRSKKAPCVGFALVFFDPFAREEERWSFSVQLAFDPNTGIDEKSRRELEKTMQYLARGVATIMGGDLGQEMHDLEDYTVEGRWH